MKTSIPGKKQKKGKLAHITAQKDHQNLQGQLISMLQGCKQVFRHSSVVILKRSVIIIVHFTITEPYTVYYVCCHRHKAKREKGPECEGKKKANQGSKTHANCLLVKNKCKIPSKWNDNCLVCPY